MIFLLKQALQWFKNHLGLFKTIFLISVVVIIVSELINIGKTLSIAAISRNVSDNPTLEDGVDAHCWITICCTDDWV